VAETPLKSASRWWLVALAGCLIATGCATQPVFVPQASRRAIDRRVMECPDGFEAKLFMTNLTCPTAFCFDESGNLIVAEGGIDGRDPHIRVVKPDGSMFSVYPVETRIPIVKPGFRIYGPVGGMKAYKGIIYVSHRDWKDQGVITAFTYTGDHKTIVADLPAQGDFGVTDLAIPPAPVEPRLYFGVGAATNSGVVGLDNWEEGWARDHRQACDLAYQTLNLLGFRFDVVNPEASLFAPNSLVTVPYAPLGTSDVTQIPGAEFPLQKPTGAIFSVGLDGGDLKVEAWGVHDPEGLALDDFGSIYLTDRGMELRGTRPVDNDPDALYQLTLRGSWLGWPDYSRSLEPIYFPQYQPPRWMVLPTGYPDVRFVIDHESSKLSPPDKDMLRATFPWQSGAGKLTFFPRTGPFHTPRFEGQALVALWGDRAPFSTTGRPIPAPLPGYRIVRVDLNSRNGQGQVTDFIFNTEGGPANKLSEGRREGLERPVDLKFGPDGNLYVLDFGQATYKHGELTAESGTGKIFILQPTRPR
jgi:glucose/arabinose dehydrogenase